MKKIWLFCLCLASLSLVGCFHVPDEDWLPSKNKVNTWDSQKDDEVKNAINEFMDGVNLISSERDDMNNEEDTEEEKWNITNEEISNNEIEGQKIEDEDIVTEE